MKIQVKDIKGDLISLVKSPNGNYDIILNKDYYETIICNVKEEDIIISMIK